MKYEIGDTLTLTLKLKEYVGSKYSDRYGLYRTDLETENSQRKYYSEAELDTLLELGATVRHEGDGLAGRDIEEGEQHAAEEELTEIGNVDRGTTVRIGGIELEILHKWFPMRSERERNALFLPPAAEFGVLCLTKDILFKKSFDEGNCNNWEGSSLRKYLNGVYKDSLPAELKNALLPFERDLMADDGLKAYGKCTDDVSLISEREYQDYRGYISGKSDWWWTLTARTAKPGYSCHVRRVYSDGSLGSGIAGYGNNGVSPAFLLLPSLKVKVVDEGESR